MPPSLSPPAEIVRRHDPDHFFTALFAPAEKREALLTLYAFDHELARARAVVTEPHLALIRLQWWRDVVEGAARRHEVATPLAEAIAAGALSPADLLPMIDAREVETDPDIPTEAEWWTYIEGSAGSLMVAAARLLGAEDPERLRPIGAAYGAARLLRLTTALAARGRCLLPLDRLQRHGLIPEAVIAKPASAEVGAAVDVLATQARARLREGRSSRVPRACLAAALPGVLARRDLRRALEPAAERGLGDRLAVMAAWGFGRV